MKKIKSNEIDYRIRKVEKKKRLNRMEWDDQNECCKQGVRKLKNENENIWMAFSNNELY